MKEKHRPLGLSRKLIFCSCFLFLIFALAVDKGKQKTNVSYGLFILMPHSMFCNSFASHLGLFTQVVTLYDYFS